MVDYRFGKKTGPGFEICVLLDGRCRNEICFGSGDDAESYSNCTLCNVPIVFAEEAREYIKMKKEEEKTKS
ncbi:hypothetical protein Mpt1_c08570 [Candidatus Methanoplasma termitum]|uniref:Uncharacterized protein n=1 Tax=Candidatus Methanoplasma termitum TaxID=1577791 RepID=A0A0A7LCL3_9ARCH|nr:hypothetical protein [Candidatus Methanoplasma termitum]AIZ56733.1 hypothetical protein Mpt1_c08570 [Candidatus Methanoplasma termitum]